MNEQERTQRKYSDGEAAFRTFLVICGLFGVAGALIGYSEYGFWGAVVGGVGGLGAWPTFTDEIAPSLAKWRTLTRRQAATRIARLATGFVAVAVGIAAIALGCFLLFADNYVWPTSILGTAWMIWITWQTAKGDEL
jgi:hypothetical protein